MVEPEKFYEKCEKLDVPGWEFMEPRVGFDFGPKFSSGTLAGHDTDGSYSNN